MGYQFSSTVCVILCDSPIIINIAWVGRTGWSVGMGYTYHSRKKAKFEHVCPSNPVNFRRGVVTACSSSGSGSTPMPRHIGTCGRKSPPVRRPFRSSRRLLPPLTAQSQSPVVLFCVPAWCASQFFFLFSFRWGRM